MGWVPLFIQSPLFQRLFLAAQIIVLLLCVCVLLSAHFLLLGLLPHCRADNAFGLMDRTETKRTFLLTLILSWRSKHGHMML